MASRPAPAPDESRVCSRCNEPKPLIEFIPDPGARFGRAYYCRPCFRSWARARRAFQKAQYKAKARSFYLKHREAVLAQNRMYRVSNRLRLTVMRGLRYDIDPNPVRDRVRRWQRSNPDRVAQHRIARQRLKRAAGADALTPRQWRQILALFDYRCAYCWRKLSRPTLDHLTPLSRGGSHIASNAVPACSRCNHRKYNRTLLEYLLIRNLVPTHSQCAL